MSHTEWENNRAEKNIITFEEGILGFEDVKDYRLYQEDDSSVIWCLQAANSNIPSFIVLDPFNFVEDYRPALTKADLEYLGEQDSSDLCFLVIAVIKPQLEESVANLKAPIVINVNTRKAKQIILENSEYPIRFKLFSAEE